MAPWPRLALLLVLAGGVWAQQPNPLAAALAKGDFSEAHRLSSELIHSTPKDPRVWTVHGLALRGLGRTADALASFDRALELSREFPPALRAAAETAYQSKSPAATHYLNRLLSAEPSDQTAHAMAGALAYESNDCARAVDHFARAGASATGNPVAAAQYAHCLMDRGRPSDAVPLLDRLLARDPHAPGVRYNLAVALLAAGKASEAAQALAGAKEDSGTLNLLGRARYQSGDVAGALDALRKAVDRAPDDDRNYMDLAIIGIERNAFEAALGVLDAGLARRPDSPRLRLLRGIVHAQSGSFEKASADFEQAERLAPEKEYGAVGLSVLLSESRQLREAATILRKRLADAPSDYLLNYLLADSLMRDGVQPGEAAFDEALRALRNSIEARPGFAKAHAAMGRLLLKAGDRDAAIRELRTALLHDPANRAALNQLLLALRGSGRSEEAAEVAAQLRRLVIR